MRENIIRLLESSGEDFLVGLELLKIQYPEIMKFVEENNSVTLSVVERILSTKLKRYNQIQEGWDLYFEVLINIETGEILFRNCKPSEIMSKICP